MQTIMNYLWKKDAQPKKQLPKGLVTEADEVFEGGSSSDIIIPIMGQTGMGKSTFINVLLGKKEMKVGEDLESCTKKIQWAIVDPNFIKELCPELAQRRVIVVDTPGFDDTNETDSEILRRIGVWLASSYCEDMTLGGIVYLQDITITRMGGTAVRNLETFQKLCGEAPLPRIMLATTRWQNADAAKAERVEAQLKGKYWDGMIAGGSTTERFRLDKNLEESRKAASKILQILLLRFLSHQKQVILKIQKELVDLQRDIRGTEAGRELLRFLGEILQDTKRAQPQSAEEKEQLKKTIEALEVQMKALHRNSFLGRLSSLRNWFGQRS